VARARRGAVPDRLEAVVIEIEVAAIAGSVEAVEAVKAGALGQQPEVRGQAEDLREKVWDAEPALARVDAPLAVQRVDAAGRGAPVGRELRVMRAR
jgi:hypothetical protein